MPPARRTRPSSGPGPAAKGAQKTLSFGTKVTKPSAALPYSKDKDSTTPHPLSQSIDVESKPEVEVELELEPETKAEIKEEAELDTGHITSEAAVAQQAKAELEGRKGEDVLRAERVTDAQIKKYWREREGERLTKRVHQEGLAVEEKILRLFDMSSSFGPAIGIARMKRWTRAQKLGLNPPIEVLAVLLREEKKGNEKIERAYVDELMSSKFVVGDAA
ncbi:putative DNA polymerase delta subunit 4 [Rhexocercosporidium sp. MPI-PUGE-AT-0058]|nr:putative DNA polymerase delta subunit 4 [Rhexocercosporidium sp. MPI-PUGE-AT-0058]